MEVKFPSKILAFVMIITHNCDSFFCWSQIFHILSSICEGFILPSQKDFLRGLFGSVINSWLLIGIFFVVRSGSACLL